MSRRFLLLIFVSSLFSLSSRSQAERILDSLTNRFAVRDSLFSSSQLYVHTDKTIYTGNENIWFTAYLLRGSQSLDQYHTLHVFLSHRVTNEVVASQQFVMNRGLSAGYIFVADSFPPGDYNLVAYTNAVSREQTPRLFQQQLSIRYGGGDPFRIELEENRGVKDSIAFLAHVTNSAMLNASGASFSYAVLSDDQPVKKGRSLVSPFGEVPLSIPMDTASRKLELQVSVQKEKTGFATRVPLSFLSKQLSFRWYPESGEWVDGLISHTAFEVTDRSGKPVAIKGQLLQDGKPVVALRSSEMGLGIIDFTPVAGRSYSVVLDDREKKVIAARLPPVRAKGAVLRVQQAVAGDTMIVHLQCAAIGKKLYLLFHNYKQVFDFWQLEVVNGQATLRVPITNMGVGLGTITLLDSVATPIAERSFFSGYDSLASIRFSADSSQYHRRSKVNLRVKMLDGAGRPLSSSFSMSAVLNKRVDTTRFQDIVPYYFFREYTDMGVIPPIPAYAMGNRADLEMLLLVRCWSRYREPVPDTVLQAWLKDRELELSGRVKAFNRKSLKKPVEISILSSAGLETLRTDSSGHFVLPPELTALAPDEKITLVINEQFKEDFFIALNHDADSLNKQLATLFYPEAEGIKVMAIPQEEESLSKVKTLSAVVVKSRTYAQQWGIKPFESQTCHDYVCMYNILNCRNHKFGTPAIEGVVYIYNGREVVYHCAGRNLGVGASELLYSLKGRYYSKEFYVADYAEFSPPDPETHSTIFWSQQLFTDEQGEATISFYTNDLVGTFSCIIEGVTPQGVISGRQLIRVIE